MGPFVGVDFKLTLSHSQLNKYGEWGGGQGSPAGRGYMFLGRGYLFWPWLFVPGRGYLLFSEKIFKKLILELILMFKKAFLPFNT
jgi:hypothetical protein